MLKGVTMRMKLLIATLAMTLGSENQAGAEEWQLYASNSMGYSVSLPTDRFAVEGESEGRLTLRELNGTAQIDVFGVTNTERLTVRNFRTMMEEADPTRRITYRAAGKSWFVLSGYLTNEPEPTIFYAKFMLNAVGTALSAFEISYPQAEKRAFDGIVEQMEDSLTAPR